MCNLRDTTDNTHDCTSCVNFTSYATEFKDELEPPELGKCAKDVAEMVGVDMVCDLWANRFATSD